MRHTFRRNVEDCYHENSKSLGSNEVGDWYHCPDCGTSGLLRRRKLTKEIIQEHLKNRDKK
jgi:hypothetical protein